MRWSEAHAVADLEFAFIVDTAETWGLRKQTETGQVVFRKMDPADVQSMDTARKGNL